LVCGTVSVKPIRNGLVSATASVAVFDWSPVTVVWRGGQDSGSRTTQDRGRFSTPLSTPYR
jgi:hypothetical protein